MKPLIALTLVLSLSISNAYAYTANTPVIASTQTSNTTLLNTNLSELLKTTTPEVDEASFSKLVLHTATNITPLQYELYPADFATNKWQKYVTSIYLQSTDVSFIMSMIYADGSLVQSNINSLEAYDKIKAETIAQNDAIRAASVEKPDKTFLPFYTDVYLKSYEKLMGATLIPYAVLNKYNLSEKAPLLLNNIVDSYQVYKKGSFYLLSTTVYPSGNQTTYVSSAIEGIQKQLNTLIEVNQKNLIDNKIIAAPVAKAPVLAAKPPVTVQFYVIIFNKDKTYTLKMYPTEKAAKEYLSDYVKKNKQANVKIAKNKDELLKLTKGLKEKK